MRGLAAGAIVRSRFTKTSFTGVSSPKMKWLTFSRGALGPIHKLNVLFQILFFL